MANKSDIMIEDNRPNYSDKNLLLISFNTKEGMKLIMDSYISKFAVITKVTAITDRDYIPEIEKSNNAIREFDLLKLSNSRNHLLMALDVFNLFLILKVIKVYIKAKPSACYFVSAHPLNPIILNIFKIIAKWPNHKVKLFSHIHDVKPHAKTKNYALIDLFQSWQVRSSDRIVVYGDTLKQMLISRFNVNPQHILVTLHGVNRIHDSKYSLKSNDRLKYVTLSGRLDKYKGINIFLEAARYFQEHQYDVQFVLAGRGDLTEYKDFINNLKNIIVINKFISNDEVDELMAESFVVMLPYIDASQSGVTPISYYNGCPVIVSNVGGLSEVVVEGKTGYVFENGNCQQAIEYTKKIVDDNRLRTEMGINCFEFYQSQLKWDVIISKLAEEIFA